MAKTKPGEIRDALPSAPPTEAEDFGAVIEDLNRLVVPGLSLWQHPRFFGYFPANALAGRNPRRSGQHRPRRDRALVAIEPGGDGSRGSRHRLAAADARAVPGLERRDPGHRLDQHAGRAHLRARAGDELRAGARRPAGRRAHSRASTCRRTRTARSTRARFWPASAATICGSFRSTPNTPCAPTRSPKWSPRISRTATCPQRSSPPSARPRRRRSIRSRP